MHHVTKSSPPGGTCVSYYFFKFQISLKNRGKIFLDNKVHNNKIRSFIPTEENE